MSNPTNKTYKLSDNQKQYLYKLRTYLIQKEYRDKVEWISPNPPPTHHIIHNPIKKIERIFIEEKYTQDDKEEMNKLREFYILCHTNI